MKCAINKPFSFLVRNAVPSPNNRTACSRAPSPPHTRTACLRSWFSHPTRNTAAALVLCWTNAQRCARPAVLSWSARFSIGFSTLRRLTFLKIYIIDYGMSLNTISSRYWRKQLYIVPNGWCFNFESAFLQVCKFRILDKIFLILVVSV